MFGFRISYGDRRFLVPLIVGFTMGFLVQLNFFILRTRDVPEDKNFLPKYGVFANNSASSIGFRVEKEINSHDLPLSPGPSKNLEEHKTLNQTHQPKILCWVMSNSAAANNVIRETWGQRCDYLLFMVYGNSKKYAVDEVRLNVSKNVFVKPTYWQKTKEAWCYIYKHYYEKADWFLATQLKSYVVIENLHRYLKNTLIHNYQSNSSIYFGHADNGDTYISTTPGYVVSKGALGKFGKTCSQTVRPRSVPFMDWFYFPSDSITLGWYLVHQLLKKTIKFLKYPVFFGESVLCLTDTDSTVIGRYMNDIGVKAVDARDVSSRLLFIPKVLEKQILEKSLDEDLKEVNRGMECCSDVAIIFQISRLKSLRVFEYMIYQLQPYGIIHDSPPLY